jgi:hypothetical protein
MEIPPFLSRCSDYRQGEVLYFDCALATRFDHFSPHFLPT